MATVRIDKWLWAARFFKTRALAKAAVEGGRVRLDGVRCKPARPLRGGETLRINRAHQEFTVVVDVVADRRGPASVAQTLFSETEESILARQEQERQARAQRTGPADRERRPDKRQRRRIVQFTRRDR